MKSHRPFVPALAGVLVVFGVMAAPATAQLTGHVQSVDVDAKRLVVTETGTGTDVGVTVPDQTPITTTAGKALRVEDLKKGDGVSIIHAGGVASSIMVSATPPALTGHVRSVDVDAKKVVVKQTGTDKEVDVTITDQTTITTMAGKDLEIKDLKQGDSVSIAHNGGVASKIRVVVKPDELTGHVKSVGANLKTFVVTETGTRTNVTVSITEKTMIVTTAGKELEIKELQEGDGVAIAHNGGVASKIVVNVKPER